MAPDMKIVCWCWNVYNAV